MDCDVNVCTAGGSDKMSKRLTHAGTENDGCSKERGNRLSHANSDSVRRYMRLAIRNGISTSSSLDKSIDRGYDRMVNNPVSLEGNHDMILTVQENKIEFYQMLKKVVRIVCRDDDPSDADDE
ncbi:hypothetical protein RHMOL_Rhmol09G0099600 [Rhododendron molle]|uniref:Uncharacterized protein n=1 Tax=Rhododendron molle TaxID=49168 RepID=A0ACC0MBX5_RHOML|nr:hypothetical protein RHMOL_Rhmol09G0099600 [Rhododendron molle]